MPRVLVIGLDGFSPNLVNQWSTDLPNLQRLMDQGIHGPLESIVQPVTPSAWTAMTSGHNPGHFGFTDFTYRAQPYGEFRLVHSGLVRTQTLPQLLAAEGYRVYYIGVPVSYPPIAIPGGACVSCFMAPSVDKDITWPSELKNEVMAATSSPYLLDAAPGRPEDLSRESLLEVIHEADRQRFDLTAHFMNTREWDLCFAVHMGTDRVGHYFMRYTDPAHLRYDPDPKFATAVRDHYRYCDQRLGDLIELAGSDTVIIVVSDHGIQRLDGKVNLNDWLAQQGYLALRSTPQHPTPLSQAPIDWSKTKAYAHGFAGQIYLNVIGRDPNGCVPANRINDTLSELSAALETLTAPDGHRLTIRTFKGSNLWSGPFSGQLPDLCIQFDDLRYLTSDLIGHNTLITPVTELGIDDASHERHGFFTMAGPGIPALGSYKAAHLLDIAPTILNLLGVTPPSDLEGRVLHRIDEAYTAEDERELTSRLSSLYLE